MRVRKKPWAEEEVNTNFRVVKQPKLQKGLWKDYFQNENHLYVEIGCGKGSFVIRNAALYQDINFIGLERQTSVIAVAARKAGDGLPNLALINGDVSRLSEYFSEGEIKRLYINFCDPWPKKKNAKRRLTYRNFLKVYRTLLAKEGEIFFKTDNQALFDFSLRELEEEHWAVSHVNRDLHHSLENETNIMTEYEKKFSEQGMPIYRLEARPCFYRES